MIIPSLFVSTLLAVSTLVRTSPLESRQDDYKTGLVNALKNKGLTKTSQSYQDSLNGPRAGEILNNLNNGETTTVLVPQDSAYGDTPSQSTDEIKYNIISGDVDQGFKSGDSSMTRRTPNQNHLKGTTKYPTDGLGDDSLRRWMNGNNNQSIFINQFVLDGRKRWDPQLFVERAVDPAKVVDRFTYKNLKFLVIDSLAVIPGKISDLLWKPLINSTPNGFPKFGSNLQKAGLLDAVDYGRRVTVFAPTDTAFNNINFDQYSDDQKSSILKNHFTRGNVVYSAQFPTTGQIAAVSGQTLQLINGGGATYVQCGGCRAQVIRSDVISQNGVVHVIDSVLKCD